MKILIPGAMSMLCHTMMQILLQIFNGIRIVGGKTPDLHIFLDFPR